MLALAEERSTLRIQPQAEIDRRMFPRKDIQLRVPTWRLDHSIRARQNPRIFLNLRDISLGGVAAQSDEPLDCGEHVTVSFPPANRQPGWEAFGRVIRCQPSALGYHVAVEFDPLPAA